MRRLFLFCSLLIAAAAQADDSQALVEMVQQREAHLEDTLQQLHEQREQIKSERLPMVQQLNALNNRVAETEAALIRARGLRDNQAIALEALRERVQRQQEELDHIRRTALPSYFANYEAALSPGERQVEGEKIRAYHLFLEKAGVEEANKLSRGLELVRESISQVDSRIGGKRFSGKALTPDGLMQTGQFIQMGPLLYFANDESSAAGLVETTRGLHAQVHVLEPDSNHAIAAVARTGTGSLPIDLSLGDALALEATKDTLTEHLAKGGIWVYPILLFALAAAIVASIKAIQIFTIRHPPPAAIHELVQALRKGDKNGAKTIAEAQPQPARDMLVTAVDHADESTEMVEEVMYESMLTTQPKLERFLNVIAVTAAAAPLLGLLGTVTGIIKTFQLMTIFGAGDPKPLISGISEALITTELGLILAIPALVLHAMLSRRVAGTMARMEKTAVMLVNGLARRRMDGRRGEA